MDSQTQPSRSQLLAREARFFRLVAVAEAWSWAGLLVGMYFKYSQSANPIGVRIMGPIHGLLFVGYVVLAWRVAQGFGWPRSRLGWAWAASVPPLATWLFERIALGRGWLTGPGEPRPRP